jgi:DDE family transposase
MPYKFNESRRHKVPKAKYRVTNWPEYDAALVKRGSLTVWMTEEAIAAWQAPATGKRGGQPIYSAIAIETSLALRLVFHQPLRQTEGLLRSIADVLKIDIAIPDHTTLVPRVAHIAGYNLFSFTRASAVVKCQSALTCFLFRLSSQAATSSTRVSLLEIRRSRH